MQLPNYLCQIVGYIFNEDGTISDDFRSDIAAFSIGDYKSSSNPSPPMGWAICDGREVPRTGDYTILFSLMGTAFGDGDGSTTFNLPDGRDRVLVGVSATKPIGWTGGAETHTLTLAETPAHQHQIAGRPLHDDPDPSSDKSTNEVIIDDDWGGGSISKTTDSRGSNQAHSSMQPSLAAGYLFVKYK